MNLSSLKTLSVVGATGSLAAAAAALSLSPAAVHKQLKQLEAELGVTLYERAGRSIRLNTAAETLMPYALSALAQVEAGRLAIDEWRGLRRGTVRLGTGPTISIHWVPGALSEFRQRRPMIQVTVDTGTTAELLASARRGELDVVFVVADGRSAPAGFQRQARWPARMMLVTGRAELAATSRRLRDLARVPFVASKQGTRLAEIASRYFLRHKHQPETAMRLDNADAVRAVVRTRFGYALLPEWTLGDDLAEGRLFALETVERPPATAMELLRPSATPLTPAVQEFIRIAQGRTLGTTKAVVSPR